MLCVKGKHFKVYGKYQDTIFFFKFWYFHEIHVKYTDCSVVQSFQVSRECFEFNNFLQIHQFEEFSDGTSNEIINLNLKYFIETKLGKSCFP